MSVQSRPGWRLTPQIIIGLCVIAYGLVVLADNFGFVDAGRVFRYWPAILVLVGLSKMWQSHTMSGRLFGGVVTFVGIALLGDFLDLVDLWNWWPIALIAVGVLMISRAFGSGRTAPARAPMAPGAAGVTSETNLSEFAFWSGIQRRVASPAFKHADLTAIMGGIELDLRQAGTAGGEAVIDVFAMWGGIEITVPPDWAVSNEIVPIMGGAEDKSTGTQVSQNRLVLRGFAIMGGIEIKT